MHCFTARNPVIAVLIVTLLAGCQTPNEYQPPPPPPVVVANPITLNVADYLESTGTTEAVETVDIRARVQGYLHAIKFESGDEVEEGQVLFVIEKAPFEADVAQAKAAVLVAQVKAVDAESKLKRTLKLLESNATTQEEAEEQKAIYDVAMAQIKAAEADLRAAELELSYTDVVSPIDGRAGKHLVDRGNLVGGLNATQLTTVIKYDPIFASFTISETQFLEIQRNAPRDENGRVRDSDIKIVMSLGDETGFPHEGRLEYADLGIDSSTGTYKVRAEFPNPDRLIAPGMFVRIRIPKGEAKPRLLVPEKAIGSDQQGRFIKKVGSDNKVELVYVEAGVRIDQWRVVESGLNAEDNVIIEGLQRARVEGDVTVKNDAESVKAATPPAPMLDNQNTNNPASEAT